MLKISRLIVVFVILGMWFGQGVLGQKLEWAGTIGGPGDDLVSKIVRAPSGNIYAYGYFEGYCDFEPGKGTLEITSNGGGDFFIAKLNPNGQLIWVKNMGGAGYEYDLGGMAIDSKENIYMAGSFYEKVDMNPGVDSMNLMPKGYQDIFLLSLDSSGKYRWVNQMGYSGYAIGADVLVTSNDEIVFSGNFQGNIDFDPGPGIDTINAGDPMNTFIMKFSNQGSRIWWKRLESNYWMEYPKLCSDPTGNIVIASSFRYDIDADPGVKEVLMSSNEFNDIYIIKLSNSGDYIWSKQIGGPGEDFVSDIEYDPNGQLVLVGYFEDSTDFDPGTSENTLFANLYDPFVCKLTNDGNFVWAKSFCGYGLDAAQTVGFDDKGNIFTAGFFNGLGDFDPGAGTFYLQPKSRDVFIEKLDASGSFKGAYHLTGSVSSDHQALALEFIPGNTALIGGFFNNFMDADPSSSIVNIASKGGKDGFINKISFNSAALANFELPNVKIYPNPSSGLCNLSGLNLKEFQNVEIFSAEGKCMQRFEIFTSDSAFDMGNWPAGVYYIKLSGSGKVFTLKTIKI